MFPISFDVFDGDRLVSRHSVRDEAEEQSVLEALNRVYGQVRQGNRQVAPCQVFHAFEIDTTEESIVAAFRSQQEADARFAKYMELLGENQIETYSLGTVEARDETEAIEKVRAGTWNYSQIV